MDSISCLVSTMPRIELASQRVTAGWRWLGADRGPAFMGEVGPTTGDPGSADFGWRTRRAARPMATNSTVDQQPGKRASWGGAVDHLIVADQGNTAITFPTRPGSRPISFSVT